MDRIFDRRYIETTRELLGDEGAVEAVRIFDIKNVECNFESHDNWNGGIDYYTVKVNVSPTEYVTMKKKNEIGRLEERILKTLGEATGTSSDIRFAQVSIVPYSRAKSDGIIVDPAFWTHGYYKIFISHLTVNKISATNLKSVLARYGISCFVAHEDIEPTEEWANAIENALLTMDCLCAIITPEFINSKWCDQEVGFALGKRVLVIPIRKGHDPYGLMGKYQGIQSKEKATSQIAEEVFNVLCKKSKNVYVRNLGNLFLNSKQIEEADRWISLLNGIDEVDRSIIENINSHYLDNDNLKDDKIIKKTNKLFVKYSLDTINRDMFVEKKTVVDGLPF